MKSSVAQFVSRMSIVAALLAVLSACGAAPTATPIDSTVPTAPAKPTAALAITPSSGTAVVGSTFTVDVVLTNEVSADAIDVVLAYDPALIDVVDADTEKKGIQAGVTEAFESYPLNDARDGELVIGAASMGDGPKGTTVIAHVTFTAKKEGTASITLPYEAGSNDDNDIFVSGVAGEDVLTSVTDATFTITQ